MAIRSPERSTSLATRSEPNSLFGEILDWMLAPLLLLWPISIAVTNHVANNIANEPYDQLLAENVTSMVRDIRLVSGKITLTTPLLKRPQGDAASGSGKLVPSSPPATKAVDKEFQTKSDEEDATYYQIRDARGIVIFGSTDLPLPGAGEPTGADLLQFRDGLLEGEPIRVAYQSILLDSREKILVQVGETRKKREALASRIISGVLLPQFAVIPMAVVLVWFGLSRGLRPLSRLRERLARRRPGDMSPLNVRRAPEELQPMLHSFNHLLSRLEENLEAQQRFIADAAHQMKTPLTGLRMQAELAMTETDPQQLRRSLEQITLGAERAGHLINQLLTLARAEASHENLHRFEIVDLEALVRSVTLEWADIAHAKHIDLGLEGSEWPLAVDGVPLLLRELLKNLIDNAIKYTPAGGRLTVRLLADEYAILEVEDDGIGIPEEDRERVFERFYRVLGSDADGSGLGLPICREIADHHRAKITLRAGQGGKGTCVVVAFPRAGTTHN